MKNWSLRPDGCIVEQYIVEEAVEICTKYISNIDSIDLPKSRHMGRPTSEEVTGTEIVIMLKIEYVLYNIDEVETYV